MTRLSLTTTPPPPYRINLVSLDAAGEDIKVGGHTMLAQLSVSPDFTGDFVVAIYATVNGQDNGQRLWTFNAAGRMDYPVPVTPGECLRVRVIDAATTGHAALHILWDAETRVTPPAVRSDSLDGNDDTDVCWFPTNGAKLGMFQAQSSGWGTATAKVVWRLDEACDWIDTVPLETITPSKPYTNTMDLSRYPQVGVKTVTEEGGAQVLTMYFSTVYD
jgi:hypothetical protein